ncbi:hypothetical protein [Campylobacter coli]|uniref:hypothetical protein n=1 Tax=Campylobacter coli TaxID=195 RepID=UPI00071727A5|nr:hypothetical protein [Campylobacter coli]KRS83180.1 hypothetical protein DA98_01625 [Campylobacter coli]
MFVKNSLNFIIIAWSNKTGYANVEHLQSFIAKALKLGRQKNKLQIRKYLCRLFFRIAMSGGNF